MSTDPLSLDDDLLTTSAAARVAELSETAVREAANRGRLPVVRTSNGTRLFRRQDVAAYRDARAQREHDAADLR